MHYIMNVGDAWFAQVPREGNIYVRSANMHDTATRCTACHPSSFSTEANLVAHRNGYPIRSKSNFQYVIDRLYNSITPLYGDDGLYWQRFIAIPLQAQGKQGSILLDFEREVSGQETKDRRAVRTVPGAGVGVAPRLAAGRAQRRRPARQQVWLRLARLARALGAGRTDRRDDFARSAANIAAILGDRAADRRIENLQDRIHRLYAWWLIDKTKHANKIKRETGALLSSPKCRRRLARARFRPGPERGLHDRAACLDAAADRSAARPSRHREGAALSCWPSSKISAAGFRPPRMRTSARRCARRVMR